MKNQLQCISSISPGEQVLIATLGGQPQVVTFTLDRLLDTYPIKTVIVTHPFQQSDHLQHSLEILKQEFASGYKPFGGPECIPCEFFSHPLSYGAQLLDDINDEQSAKATMESLFELLRELKQHECIIHLSITGGRRLMATYGQMLANLILSLNDCVWHIHTPDAIQQAAQRGNILHVPESAGVRLIPIPFIPLSSLLPLASPAFSAAERQSQVIQTLSAQEHARCVSVLRQCTPAEETVLRAYGAGKSQQEIIRDLVVSENTVRKHTKRLLALVRNAWALPNEMYIDYHFLYRVFHSFFLEKQIGQ